MTLLTRTGTKFDLRKIQKTIKLTVYTLLVIHFGFYIYEVSLSHWRYTWDTVVWIAAFTAIGLIFSDWRDQMVNERSEHHDVLSAQRAPAKSGR